MISNFYQWPSTHRYIAHLDTLVQIHSEDRTAVSSCLPCAGGQAQFSSYSLIHKLCMEKPAVCSIRM